MTRIDFLFIRRSARASDALFTTRDAAFSKRTNFRLPLLIVATVGLIYIFWPTYAQDQQAAEPMTIGDRMLWSDFSKAIDKTSQVETIDDAFGALSGLSYFVGILPYEKDKRHQFDAYASIDQATNHLIACETGGRTDPYYWRAELREALSTIPKYAGRIDDTAPPPIDLSELR